MEQVEIIALSGYIGSGKDHIAKLMEEQFGYKHLKLAGLVKLNYCLIHGITLEKLEGRRYKEKARPHLIALSEKMKEIDTFIHCHYVYHQILSDLKKGSKTGKYVISDLRFPYEDSYFRKFDRCSNNVCDVNFRDVFGMPVRFQSIYVESNLADKSSKVASESYYESFLKPNRNGLIINGIEQRYDRHNRSLINQLIKYV